MKFIQGRNGRYSEEAVMRGKEEVKGDETKEEKGSVGNEKTKVRKKVWGVLER